MEFALDNFAVIEIAVYAIDFVFLNKNGNKSVYFDYHANDFQWR